MQYYKHKKTGKLFERFITIGSVTYYAWGVKHGFPSGPELIPEWMILDSPDWEDARLFKCTFCGKRGFNSNGPHFKIKSLRDKILNAVIPCIGGNYFSLTTGIESYRGTAESFLNAPDDRYEIHSVLRTCDSVLFKVGSHVMVAGDLEKIRAFSLKDGQCLITLDNEAAKQVSFLDPSVFKAVVLDLANPSPTFLEEVFEGLGI